MKFELRIDRWRGIVRNKRLKASYTVENSFIMPLFIIVIVLLLYVCFYIHDAVILKNSALKLAIRVESNEEDWQRAELRQEGIDYIREKTICTQNTNVIIENNKGNIKVSCTGYFSSALKWMNQTGLLNQSATVNKNKPENFIRIINAVKDVIR